MKVLLIILQALTFLSLSSSQDALAIRYGDRTAASEYQATGFLFAACTATLINPNTAITANHCLYANNLAASTFTVSANGKKQTMHPIKKLVLSSGYLTELVLIRFRESVNGINFPALSTQIPQNGELLHAVGFGANGVLPRIDAKLVGTVKVSAVGQMDLNDGFGPSGMIRVVSGDAKNQIACSGDSGGPLLNVQGELVGVASFATGVPGDKSYLLLDELTDRCLKTKFLYYVPIAAHLPWIKTALAQLDQN